MINNDWLVGLKYKVNKLLAASPIQIIQWHNPTENYAKLLFQGKCLTGTRRGKGVARL